MVNFFQCIVSPFIYLKTIVLSLFLEYDIQKRLYQIEEYEKIDLYLLSLYKKKNPYTISKEFAFLHHHGNLYTFGPSPLQLYEKIHQDWIGDNPLSFLELGCGTSRGLLYLYFFSNCKVFGVDWNDEFILKAKKTLKLFEVNHVKVWKEDYLSLPHYKYDMIYLFELFLEKESLIKLLERLYHESLSHTQIITTSFPLSDFDSRYIVKKKFEFRFFFGKSTVYLNTKKVL